MEADALGVAEVPKVRENLVDGARLRFGHWVAIEDQCSSLDCGVDVWGAHAVR